MKGIGRSEKQNQGSKRRGCGGKGGQDNPERVSCARGEGDK